MMKRTPFYDRHLQLGARISGFGGYEMPIQYSSIRQEHLAVREAAGLFDVSHMGEFLIDGSGALPLVQRLTTNDVNRIEPGQVQYSVMCNERGGIIDDLLVYRLGDERFMLVVNAANIEKDRAWITSHLSEDARFEDRSEQTVLLALQGPDAEDVLQELTDLNLSRMQPYTFQYATVAGIEQVLVSATGYTGERGFELYLDLDARDPSLAMGLWDRIMERTDSYALQPAGLGARDTLRLEVGFPLYGSDLDEEISPLEAGLGWLTRLEKGEFLGSDILKKQKEQGVTRKLAGFIMKGRRQIPRSGYDICLEDGKKIGTVTSGSQSILLEQGIGLGYLPPELAVEGTTVFIPIRNKLLPAEVTKPPFFNKTNL